jgi:hypothetical protein
MARSHRKMLSAGFLIAVMWSNAATRASAFDEIDAYAHETIHGFTVLVHRDVEAHADEAAEMRRELRHQLHVIGETLPERPLAELRKVRIWVEWEAKPNGAAEFHPSAEWLREHGYNPAKAGDVEINNARNFVSWSRSHQPSMMLHELAHAYHFRVLGYDHAAIQAAFKRAVAEGKYDEVDHVDGSRQKAYALTDAKEYFAELTEAYFGKNDFFPYERAELKSHDQEGYAVLEQAWGDIAEKGINPTTTDVRAPAAVGP